MRYDTLIHIQNDQKIAHVNPFIQMNCALIYQIMVILLGYASVFL